MDAIVVGGGLAGLAAAMKLAENGCHVKLVSVTKAKRSHSVCAQGGINAYPSPFRKRCLSARRNCGDDQRIRTGGARIDVGRR